MNKRGQVYILAAIILAVILYSLSTTVNYIKQEKLDEDFGKLSKNYELESTKLINNLLLQEVGDINESFNTFTVLFTSYSKSQNPSYGLVYTLSFKDINENNKIQIGNYLNKKIYIDDETTYLEGCFGEVDATLTFEGLNLGLGITQQDIEDCILTMDFISSMKIGIPTDEEEIIWYNLRIIQNKPQIMIVSHLEEGEQRSVFVGGEGFVTSDE